MCLIGSRTLHCSLPASKVKSAAMKLHAAYQGNFMHVRAVDTRSLFCAVMGDLYLSMCHVYIVYQLKNANFTYHMLSYVYPTDTCALYVLNNGGHGGQKIATR